MSAEAIFIWSLFGLLWIVGAVATWFSASLIVDCRWPRKILAAAVLLILWPWLAFEIIRRLP